MGKVFNITADCKPELHYMVNIDSRLKKIKELIDKGEYFAINRAGNMVKQQHYGIEPFPSERISGGRTWISNLWRRKI